MSELIDENINEILEVNPSNPSEIEDQNRILKELLKQRIGIIEALQTSYVRDVTNVKDCIFHINRTRQLNLDLAQLASVPSVDLRRELTMRQPNTQSLNVDTCGECGGNLEIIHYQSDTEELFMKFVELQTTVEEDKAIHLKLNQQVNSLSERLEKQKNVFMKENVHLMKQKDEYQRKYELLKIENNQYLSKINKVKQSMALLEQKNEKTKIYKREIDLLQEERDALRAKINIFEELNDLKNNENENKESAAEKEIKYQNIIYDVRNENIELRNEIEHLNRIIKEKDEYIDEKNAVEARLTNKINILSENYNAINFNDENGDNDDDTLSTNLNEESKSDLDDTTISTTWNSVISLTSTKSSTSVNSPDNSPNNSPISYDNLQTMNIIGQSEQDREIVKLKKLLAKEKKKNAILRDQYGKNEIVETQIEDMKEKVMEAEKGREQLTRQLEENQLRWERKRTMIQSRLNDQAQRINQQLKQAREDTNWMGQTLLLSFQNLFKNNFSILKLLKQVNHEENKSNEFEREEFINSLLNNEEHNLNEENKEDMNELFSQLKYTNQNDIINVYGKPTLQLFIEIFETNSKKIYDQVNNLVLVNNRHTLVLEEKIKKIKAEYESKMNETEEKFNNENLANIGSIQRYKQLVEEKSKGISHLINEKKNLIETNEKFREEIESMKIAHRNFSVEFEAIYKTNLSLNHNVKVLEKECDEFRIEATQKGIELRQQESRLNAFRKRFKREKEEVEKILRDELEKSKAIKSERSILKTQLDAKDQLIDEINRSFFDLKNDYNEIIDKEKERVRTSQAVAIQVEPIKRTIEVQTDFITPNLSLRQSNSLFQYPDKLSDTSVVTIKNNDRTNVFTSRMNTPLFKKRNNFKKYKRLVKTAPPGKRRTNYIHKVHDLNDMNSIDTMLFPELL